MGGGAVRQVEDLLAQRREAPDACVRIERARLLVRAARRRHHVLGFGVGRGAGQRVPPIPRRRPCVAHVKVRGGRGGRRWRGDGDVDLLAEGAHQEGLHL